jgi:hypothetical protein
MPVPWGSSADTVTVAEAPSNTPANNAVSAFLNFMENRTLGYFLS